MANAKKKQEMLPKGSDKEAKRKALATAIAQLEKDYGAGTVMKLGENNSLEVQAVSTGSISLDLALGIGGVPRGRIIEIFGPESSGNTTVALHIIAEVQKNGGEAAFIDAEHALDPIYAKALGVDIRTNMVVGKINSVDELLQEFDAVFIGTGAGLPRFMSIPGESLCGVYSANEFLTRINLMKAYKPDSDTPIIRPKRAAIVGGGNVAMDAARCAKRLGADEVYVIYRRSEQEMPARREEVEHAKEEGIIFKMLTNPVEILEGENKTVRGIRCVSMELGEPDASGRRSPVEIKDSAFDIELDCVIMAIGTSPNPLIRTTTEGLECDKRGCIVTLEDGVTTTKSGVYAGGDAVTGAATVILAMGAGKAAAEAIDGYVKEKK